MSHVPSRGQYTIESMPVYSSDQQMYACFGLMFDSIKQNSSKAEEALLKSGLVYRIQVSEPQAELTIDARRPPLAITYGPAAVRPTLDISMRADTLHCVLLKKLGLRKALGANLIRARGPVWKTVVLADLFHDMQQYYPDIVSGYGLSPECSITA